MKKKILTLLIIFLFSVLLFPGSTFAREGIVGYEGGISSGEVPGKTTLDYQEVSFISGEPVVFKGTLTLKKSQRQNKLTTTYTYNLKSAETDGTLTRVMVFDTTSVTMENGQVTESAELVSARENMKIGGVTYNIANRNGFEFTRSNLIDLKPAIQYHAGSVWSKKTYTVGAVADGNTVTVECTGRFYGYDQYWGNAESLLLDYIITAEKFGDDNADKWGGTASVVISSTSTEQLEYQKNKPNQISFSGSYVQSRMNSNVMEYSCLLPEFDAKGVSTDHVIGYKDSLKIETFPSQRRLPTADPTNIRGHWAEENIKIMFGLEVFKGSGANFNPDHYMNRAEFAAAMVQIVKEIPADPALTTRTRTTASRKSAAAVVVSPYNDVSVENIYFSQIRSAFERGLLAGRNDDRFAPNENITKADATLAFIRALGLEYMAPTPVAVTSFRDNDLIPYYARNAAYVAQRIGLLQGDNKGNMNPNKKLTKAECAVMLNNLIRYLQDGIRKDYRERLVNY